MKTERCPRQITGRLYESLGAVGNAELGGVYLELVKLRNDFAHSLGYENYAAYAYPNLYGRDYTPEEALDFCRAVMEQVTPLFESWKEAASARSWTWSPWRTCSMAGPGRSWWKWCSPVWELFPKTWRMCLPICWTMNSWMRKSWTASPRRPTPSTFRPISRPWCI